ncbi:class I SAM-dependent methyltransferase [Sandaracinobacter neustonicus]|uniref:Class I SAM-dependent methyltransferase n=1 Tax=Sandaracinobacter neustonicus TaxID=1715348 RepID=A0A501XDV4_9SPHN|nr:class I SAM-dependent methyltransferase [Sandaracinobacter neustonicus]TPE58497.1 class I SAM-dependent methyltransferase [Sandaracinobacter neustonicus]
MAATDPGAQAFWDARFGNSECLVFGEAPNLFLSQQAHLLPPGSDVLAVADGEGRNGVWLAEQGHRVTATDISPVGQAKARALAAKRGVTLDFVIADLDEWDWPEADYDAVVAIFIQFFGPDARARMFQGMKRAVRPGGLILLQGYRNEQLSYGTGGPGAVENLYTEALLRELFADWQIEHLAVHDSALAEGPAHNGMSALIDLVARRPANG